ncbi:hypothetical protein SBOR_4264 [Sclerotinia borealis F-4128]|uniref:Uncharacterized protein n=1 Tax=Sclerotinia borealis (strain F-4128) TaxID=1432307 RepID=W9CLG5_SCLBF|nr:hypothetical protein SBOR_4264 [Sclerotinia borealis F-4128]
MEAQSQAQSLSECNQCGKKFQRKAHLLRHQQQHSGVRPYSCIFCFKTFKRSDVLRDHFSRCELRGSAAIPDSLERGRKRHACDECSRLKVKCDNEVPCRKCKEFGRCCVKTRSSNSASSTKASASPEMPPPLSLTPPSTTPEPPSDRNSISFLLNFPNVAEFMREFPKVSTVSPENRVAEHASLFPQSIIQPWVGEDLRSQNVANFGYSASMEIDPNVAFLQNLEFETFERLTLECQFPADLWPGPDDMFLNRNVLEQRAFDIQKKLGYAASSQAGVNAPSKEIIEAIELITPITIAAYIKLYFKHWHHHAPMVHEATLNPCTAALPLVLSVMSLGAMYSKHADEVAKIKLLLDTIETYIYSIIGFSDEYDLPSKTYAERNVNSSQEWLQYQLEEFQGAYLIVVVQYWIGNEIARTRVRQQRFARLISIYRSLELNVVQHSPGVVIKDQYSFRDWIRTESYIRTASVMMMLDNAFAIFNNLTPRLQWAEIDLAFPGNDEYFKAATYDDLGNHSGFPIPTIKIKDAFLLLFSPMETADKDLMPLCNRNITALDMQMLIHILYVHIWNSTFCNPLVQLPTTSIFSLVAPFKLALRNWKLVWDEIKSASDADEWMNLGFERTAETYYFAVISILRIFESKDGKFPAIPSDCDKGAHLQRLLSF